MEERLANSGFHATAENADWAMCFVTQRRTRFSLILIMPIITVVLASLFSNSDLLGLLAIAITLWMTLPIFATDVVEARIGKRRLNWPRESLKLGTHLWGFAALLIAIQFAINNIGSDLPFPDTHGVLAWCGLFFFGIAGFQTTLTIAFIMNPKYRLRINLASIFLGLVVSAADVMTVFFLILLYPTFGMMPIVGKAFTLLLIPSIVSSIPFWWATWTKKTPRFVNVMFLLLMSPYLFLIALFLIGYVLLMISY